MTPSFGSRRRGKRLALPKHLWEKRREKGSRSYQSEHTCSAPCVLGLSSAYFYPLSDAMRGNRDVHGAKLPEPIVSCSRGRSTVPGAASARRPSLAFSSLIASYTSDAPVRSQPRGRKSTFYLGQIQPVPLGLGKQPTDCGSSCFGSHSTTSGNSTVKAIVAKNTM